MHHHAKFYQDRQTNAMIGLSRLTLFLLKWWHLSSCIFKTLNILTLYVLWQANKCDCTKFKKKSAKRFKKYRNFRFSIRRRLSCIFKFANFGRLCHLGGYNYIITVPNFNKICQTRAMLSRLSFFFKMAAVRHLGRFENLNILTIYVV